MKALVTGFHMLYRLSQDSKYPWSGPAVEIPRLPVTVTRFPNSDPNSRFLLFPKKFRNCELYPFLDCERH